ncbi:hypothetical protein V9T40_008328 [Parthenolecanium corni]|uniref:Digestive cysteine proteinase 1 n=1 Tax=Parthenolecanium corni TaxID=536013 RepID=A0AAN9Y7S1_9HEMI
MTDAVVNVPMGAMVSSDADGCMLSLSMELNFAPCGLLSPRLVDGDISERTPPKFPSSYIAKAIMFIPYSEIMEPFQAWYDENTKSSRVDYYGGMVKTYQLANNGKYGRMLKVAPVTTESSLNVKTCLALNGTQTLQISLQSVLPDIKDYKYMGQEVVRGVEAEKWQFKERSEDKITKYTLYVSYTASTLNVSQQIPVPVKFVMKGMNAVFGSHFDHYWIEYESFTDEKPDPTVFAVEKQMQCQGFPGPGIDHYYTFNPMAEFFGSGQDFLDKSFEQYKRTHKRDYSDLTEHEYRKEVFKHNARYIRSHNRANLSYKLAVNHLADRTQVELKALNGRKYTPGFNGGKPFPYSTKKEIRKAPASFDWRIYGAVTPVKDQSVCGSCWSFGTTGAIEGEYFVHSGILYRLSQQALIDCSWGFGNNGCDGGEDFRAYEWMMKHGGLPVEDEYGPYFGQDGFCHSQNVTLVAPITGFVNVTPNDESALKVALLKHGPISVAIDASHRSFSFYSHGVYFEPECGNSPESLDHAVLLVGYGKLYEKDYWLVKNSWSVYWGNAGYVLMSPKSNNCGVMTSPTYATFK